METPPYEDDMIAWDATHIGLFKDVNNFDHTLGLDSEVAIPVLNYKPLHTKPSSSSKQGDSSVEKKPAVSVSSTFYPGSYKRPADTILRSSDSVLFYVNSQEIVRTSPDAFKTLLGASLEDKSFRHTFVDIPDHSGVLNVILHVFFDLSPARHSPALEVLETAVARMYTYGLIPSNHIIPSKPLFDLLLSHAPISPIRVYTLAAEYGLHDLAVQTSSHLLSYPLSDISDEQAKRMGAKYLRRLMTLHFTRVEELKRIILNPPPPHPATMDCDFAEQKKLSRAWALAASYLAWDSRPDLSVHAIQSTFSTLGDHLTCPECKVVLKNRIKEVVVQWVNVKTTI